MDTIAEPVQGSLFGPGVDLDAPAQPQRPTPRNRRKQAPLRTCKSCGKRFRSWSEDRYCGSQACVEIRLYGPAGKPAADWEQTWTPEHPVPFNEFPPGF